MSEHHHCVQSEILDLMPERVVRFAVGDHSILYCNRAWALGHGAPAMALVGRRLDDLLTTPEITGMNQQLSRLDSGLPMLADPEPLPAPEGSGRWLAWRDQLVEDGREVLAVGRDVTERRRAEQELAASEARFRELADRASDVVFHIALTPHPHFTYLSPAVERLLGVSVEELTTDLDRFVEMLDADGRAVVLAALSSQEMSERFDLRFRHPDGRMMVGEIQVTSLPDGIQGIARDVTEVRALQAELAALAARDPLTGLVNRRLLDELLASALSAARRNGTTVTVAYLDLNDFKAVNDIHGHDAGDQVLRVTARRLLLAVRANDVVARVGGDELVLVLAGNRSATDDVIHRVREVVAQPIDLPDGSELHLTASIGRASTDEVGWDPTRLLATADTEMYEAKHHRQAMRPA